MNRLFGCAIAMTVALLPTAALAQITPEVEQQCETAFTNAGQLLGGNNRQLTVTNTRVSEIAENYSSFPRGRSVALSLFIDGRDADNVMMSPQLLTTISRTIIEGCQPIGMISFVRAETDWVTTFGWVNGQVREFECIDYDGESLPPWGTTVCI